MNDKRNALMLVAALACFLGAAALPAGACNVPVCRFALERWEPDDYQIVVFHRGPLAGGAQAAVKLLKGRCEAESARANLYVSTVDLAGEHDEDAAQLWKAQKGATLPWAVLRYPERFRADPTQGLWAGPMTVDAAKALVDSPVRREIAKRIIAGDAAVWVLLTGGGKATDAAAAAVLTKELAVAQREFTAPAPAAADPFGPEPGDEEAFGPPAPEPMEIKFSVLRLSRTDPAEAPLVSMLTNSEPDLATKYASRTMAFPVFGRGRSLYGFVGKGIDAENVLEACAFLVGPCSCMVKELNPGTDLLIAANWDAVLEDERFSDPAPPPLTSLRPVATGTAAAVAQAASPGPAAPWGGAAVRSRGHLLRNIAIAVGLIVAVAAVVAAVTLRRGGSGAVRT